VTTFRVTMTPDTSLWPPDATLWVSGLQDGMWRDFKDLAEAEEFLEVAAGLPACPAALKQMGEA